MTTGAMHENGNCVLCISEAPSVQLSCTSSHVAQALIIQSVQDQLLGHSLTAI